MQTIYLDISNKGIIPAIHAKQGDVGRKFLIKLTNSGEVYHIPDGVAFSVWYSGASGEGNYTHISDRSAFVIDGNTVTVELITQMLNNAGEGKLCLVMSGADGSNLASWNIPYAIEHVPGMDSDAAEQYYTAFSETAKQVAADAARAEAAAAKFDILTWFPVGYIYMSASSVSPATLFGGTWEQIKDMFLLGCGDSFAAGASGGSAVTSHNHGLPVGIGGGYIYADSKNYTNPIHVESGSAYAVAAGASEITVTNRTVSDSTYLDNMPPYLAVYMWKRVA